MVYTPGCTSAIAHRAGPLGLMATCLAELPALHAPAFSGVM